jgi:ankyrin repeat protein
MASAIDDEPEVVDSPHRDKELEAQDTDLEASSDEDDEEEVSAKKRFEEITHDLKSGQLDLRNEGKLKEFAIENASYLDQKTTGDGDHNTLLHMLVEDSKDKVFDTYQPLVKLLLERHPQLLGEKDSNEKTPLYIAISKKRDKLVRFMCDSHANIDSILSIPCYHSENCLHVAIRRNVSPKLAIFLIQRAGEGTLCAKDDKGNTPLNLAVDYERSTEAQLEIVEALIERCDKAIDERTNAPNFFSPYRYHEYTRAEWNKAAEAAKKASKDEKDITPGRGEELSSAGREDRDRFGAKAKTTRQTNDPKVPPPMPVPKAPSIPTPPGPEQSSKSNSSLRRVGTGERGIPGSSDKDKYRKLDDMALNIPLNISRAGASDGSRTPTTTKPIRAKKRTKEEAKVTEESADTILNYLKLHCMRTRNHDDAVDFLYGRSQGNPPSPFIFIIFYYDSLWKGRSGYDLHFVILSFLKASCIDRG